MSPQPTQYVSPQRIARDLDVTDSFVRKAMDRGDLRWERIGSMRRVPLAEYLAWVDTLRAPGKK